MTACRRSPSGWTAPTPSSDLRALETLVREIGSRPAKIDTSAIEWMFDDLGRKLESVSGATEALTPFIDALSKIEARIDAVDPAPLEQAIRELGDRLDAQGGATLDDEQVARAAAMIAERLGSATGLGVDAELLLRQVTEIHDRLDAIGSDTGSNSALEKTVSDLVAEFEDTRKLLLEVVEPASHFRNVADGVTELRAEQANAERRMSARVSRVQEILEELSERLGDLEGSGPEPAPRPAQAPQAGYAPQANYAPQPAANPFAIGDIPDRPRPLPQVQSAPSHFARSADEGRAIPIEPGAVARARLQQQPTEAPLGAQADRSASPYRGRAPRRDDRDERATRGAGGGREQAGNFEARERDPIGRVETGAGGAGDQTRAVPDRRRTARRGGDGCDHRTAWRPTAVYPPRGYHPRFAGRDAAGERSRARRRRDACRPPHDARPPRQRSTMRRPVRSRARSRPRRPARRVRIRICSPSCRGRCQIR